MRNKNFTLAIIFASCALFTSSFTLTAQTASQQSLHPTDEYTPPVPDYIMDKINAAIRLGEYIDKMEALYGVFSPSTEEIQTMRLQSFTPLLQNESSLAVGDSQAMQLQSIMPFSQGETNLDVERIGVGTNAVNNARIYVANNNDPNITQGIRVRTLVGSSGVSRIQGVHSASSAGTPNARVYGVKTTATASRANSFAYGVTAVATVGGVNGANSRAYGVRAIVHGVPTGSVNTSTVIGVYSNVASGGAPDRRWAGLFQGGQVEVRRGNLLVEDGRLGIGTTNPRYELDVNGVIRAREVKVNVANGADFVFYDDFVLRPLDEVYSFVRENRHLPDVPSAADMIANGLDIGEFQILLLQKIEELTLYIIEQDRRIRDLESR